MSYRLDSNEMLGFGRFGFVYPIEDDKVVKIMAYSIFPDLEFFKESYDRFYEGLKYEYDMQKRLYSDGISVPEPFGVFDILVDVEGEERYVPGFVMERIHGEFLMEIGETHPEHFDSWNKYGEELSKAFELGYFSQDLQGNAIWNCKEKKLTLIDFGLWRFEG